MTSRQQWAESDTAPWTKINESLDALDGAYCFAQRKAAHSGLDVAYGGGTFDVNTVADGTVTCTDAATNYLVAHRTTRAVTTSTATTNWNDTAVYGRVARAVFAAGVLTYYDERFGAGGIFDRSGAAGGALLAANNLSDVANAATARTNLGVDTAIAAAVAGLSWKQAVRAATTAAGTLATSFANASVIDGVTLATGDRILIKNQAAGAENGIYVVAASGAPARASDANSGAELVNASVYVSEGTTQADTQWTCTTNATITPDTTSLAFAQLSSGGGSVATDAIWDAAGDLAQGTGANTAARLPIGTALQILRVNAGATAVEWATASGGSTQGRHAIFIAAGSMAPSVTGGCASLARIASAADNPDIVSLNFDPTTQEYAQFYLTMPKSWDEGTVTFAPVWSHAATTTNFGVVFDLQGYAASNDDAIATAFGTAQTSTDTGGTTNDIYMGPESAAITIAGTPAAEDTVFFRVSRVTGNGGDTMAIDARLMGIVVYLTTNADTDA